MTKLPDQITMKLVLHMKLAKGGYCYLYSNDEFGVSLSRGKETRNHERRDTWMREGVDGEFSTYGELLNACKE